MTPSPTYMDGSFVYDRWRQCASNTLFLAGPSKSTPQTASPPVQPFFAQLTAERSYNEPLLSPLDST